MRKNKRETRWLKQAFSNKRGDRWQPSWPMGWREDEDWEHIPLQLSFISFSRSKAGDSREVAASCWVLLCGLLRQKDLYYSKRRERNAKHTHTNFVDVFQVQRKKQRAKNDFGRKRRTPLACSSCFTVRFACIARRVAVAKSCRFFSKSSG